MLTRTPSIHHSHLPLQLPPIEQGKGSPLSMEFDLENPLTTTSDDHLALLAAEPDHFSPLSAGLLDLSARRAAASLILQVQFTSDLDPSIAYLAVNYVDRFLAKQQIPSTKPWVVRLLAVACLSLACKMRPPAGGLALADIQKEEGFIFDAETVRRMELVVLGALEWRMRSITPFSFLNLFLAFFAHPPLLLALKTRTTRVLFRAQTEIKMLEFKPSEVAAAALLSAAREIFPAQYSAFRSAVSNSGLIDEARLWECCNAMGYVVAADDGDCVRSHEGLSSCGTPVTVLTAHHHHCSSSESERTLASSAAGGDQRNRRASFAAAAAELDHP